MLRDIRTFKYVEKEKSNNLKYKERKTNLLSNSV